MTRRFIPVEESFRKWDEDAEFRAAYGVLEEEFALAGTLIEARGKADMTQEQVAQAMGTTQAAIVAGWRVAAPCHPPELCNATPKAERRRMRLHGKLFARLESGRTMPSTRTLQRYAKATGTRLRIQLEPEKPGSSAHPLS